VTVRGPRFRYFPVTADVGMRLTSPSAGGIYEAAARGLFSLITDRRRVREVVGTPLRSEGEDPADLLVAWLNELIFRFDARGEVFRRVDVTSLSDRAIQGTGYGEAFDPKRHPCGTMVKAATRHRLSMERRGDLWVATVILDL
jgi:SHS2 domain-containing protein